MEARPAYIHRENTVLEIFLYIKIDANHKIVTLPAHTTFGTQNFAIGKYFSSVYGTVLSLGID